MCWQVNYYFACKHFHRVFHAECSAKRNEGKCEKGIEKFDKTSDDSVCLGCYKAEMRRRHVWEKAMAEFEKPDKPGPDPGVWVDPWPQAICFPAMYIYGTFDVTPALTRVEGARDEDAEVVKRRRGSTTVAGEVGKHELAS